MSTVALDSTRMYRLQHSRDFVVIIAIALFASIVFLLDLILPLGIAAGVLYVGVVGLTLWLDHAKAPIVTALVCTVLIVLAYLLSPPGLAPWIDVTSRILETFAIWTTSVLVVLRQRADEALREAHDALERRVQERTAELAHAIDAAHRELTERQRAEDARALSEERFQWVARATNDAVWDWNLASDTIWFSDAVSTLFGYPYESVGPSLQWWWDRLHPEDLPAIRASLDSAIAAKRDAWFGEYRFRRADGSFADVLDRAYILYDSSGRPVRLIGSMMDITERKRDLYLLQESREQYRQLFEHNPLPTWVHDTHTLKFLAVNEAAVRHYGYSREEFLAMTILDIRPSEDIPRLLKFLPTMDNRPEGGINIAPWRHRKKDGTVFDIELAYHPLVYEGHPARLVIIHDITERQQMEQMKAQLLDRVISAQEEERRRIARELHDEVGQSLTALLVGLRTLDPMLTQQPGGHELWKIAAQALDEVQRLALGLRPSVLDDLGLEAALRRYMEDFSRVHGTPVDVQMMGVNGTRLPYAVETSVYRIAQEALTNVARHANASSISVVVRRTPSMIQLLVEDDGKGFDVERVLSGEGGEHLGLHGMRERVTLLGGMLSIESQQGAGTTVSASLPLAH